MTRANRGFTLIELLVVIAIIGVLSAIVLASLNSARDKGGDGAIKGNLGNVRPQSEIIYNDNGNYLTGFSATPDTWADCPTTNDGTIFSTANIASQIDAAKRASDTATSSAQCVTDTVAPDPATMWAVAVKLKSNVARGWCVDSKGTAVEVDWAQITGTTGSSSCPQ